MRKLMVTMQILFVICIMMVGCQNEQMDVDENYEQKYIEELRLETKRLERELEAATTLIEELQSELAKYSVTDDYDNEMENSSPLYLSVSLTADGQETLFSNPHEIQLLADILIGKEQLEDMGSLEVPEHAVIAMFQDGPGSNFKLKIYPAYVEELEKEVLVIQGELLAFYTSINDYEVIQHLLP